MSDDRAPVWFDGDMPHVSVRRRTLACGLDVVVHADATVPTVTASMNYRVGSSDDRSPRTGFAHLFEHLFKSSPQRLGGHHYDILRRAGASDANASTSTERTRYHETLPSNQLDLVLWIESSRMGYFLDDFHPDTLVTQKSVVRSERRQRYEDVAYGAEGFAISSALWPEGHALRHLTIGLHEDIEAATVDDVAAFYRTWYVPANATLVVAGDVGDEAMVDDAIDRYFGSFPASQRPTRSAPPTLGPLAPIRETTQDRFAALPRIHRAWYGPLAFGADEPALDLLAAAWSAVGTGALWQRLVYETQLAQRVAAWCSSTRIGGEFHISVDLRTGSDPAAVRAIVDAEVAKILAGEATAELDRQLQRIITRREAGTMWSLTSIAKRVSAIQRYVMYLDDADGYAIDLARHRAVTAAAVTAAATRWLSGPFVEIETLVATGASTPARAT
ncbi:MAG: pitrilysin family protein [Proteobacteria bacterium]|nr:pitrilysin family protein [Pseudomonadota bacterium]